MPLINRPLVTVSTTAILVAAANPARKRIWITQTSANAIRLGGPAALGTIITASLGIRLGQNERLLIEGSSQVAPCPTGEFWAIREGGADGTVAVVEEADV